MFVLTNLLMFSSIILLVENVAVNDYTLWGGTAKLTQTSLKSGRVVNYRRSISLLVEIIAVI
jgi:hypothetical protein